MMKRSGTLTRLSASIICVSAFCFSCKSKDQIANQSQEKAVVATSSKILWTADMEPRQPDGSVTQCWYKAILAPSQRIAIKKDSGLETFYNAFGTSLKLVEAGIQDTTLEFDIRSKSGFIEASNLLNDGGPGFVIGLFISPITMQFLKGDKTDATLKEKLKNQRDVPNQVFSTDETTADRLESYIVAKKYRQLGQYPCPSASSDLAKKSIGMEQANLMKAAIPNGN